MDEKEEACPSLLHLQARRSVLRLALGVGLGLPLIDLAAAQETDPKKARPQEGDRLVFALGDRKGQPITPADLPQGGALVMAYPMDPRGEIVRDGSRLNEIMLVRLDPGALVAETGAHAVDGIVAYSAICTHAGCEVSEWLAETQQVKCPCHYAVFDPKDGARVVSGPAPRRLSRLPLKIVEGVLMAAGGFSGRVGFQGGGG